MMDEGLPISYEVLNTGVAVFASDGAQVGVVESILAAPEEDIFHGLVVRVEGVPRFAAADVVAELHERGVDLSIDSAAARELPPPEEGGPVVKLDAQSLGRPWRSWWDRITGRRQ